MRAPATAAAVLCALIAFTPSRHVHAQGTIALNVGSTPQIFVVPGTTASVPIQADITGAGATAIASLSSGITWNTLSGGFAFSTLVVGPTGWSFSTNTAGAAAGSVSFTTSNGTNLPATNTLATVSFSANTGTPGTRRGTRIVLAPTASANAAASSILALLRARTLDVCIADESDALLGDVNDDNIVNILDAQQIARRAVGLSVGNPTATTNRGDVTQTGAIDIIDAQQTARKAVVLPTPAAPNVGAPIFTALVVASHTLSPSTPQSLTVGNTLQITNTPRDASSNDLTGCAGSTWNSSNPAVATVNASGLVSAIAAGTTVITSTSSVTNTVTAQLTVNVTGGNPATQLVLTQAAAGAVSGAAFASQPVIEIRDATNTLVASATNQVTATLTSGTGALVGTASVNAVGGVATFAGLRIDAAGAKTLTFTSGVLTSATTNFTVTAGPLASISVGLAPSTVALNGTSTATATGFDAALNSLGPVASPVWSTNNFRIARVTSAGGIQGIGSGSANIIATSGAISGSSALTVNAAAGNFSITMINVTALTPSVQQAFTDAATRWSQIIRGDLPDYNGAALSMDPCGTNVPAGTFTPTSIDDILIYVNVAPIDGPGAILGSAGPCYTFPSPRPLVGTMRFDSDDMAGLEASGRLGAVIMHEMGHVLGIGTLWGSLLLNPAPANPDPAGDPTYDGTNAKWAFQNLGTGYGGAIVPVENCCAAGTRNGHWRESILLRELMTGFVSATGQPNPLSPLTAASLIDQGYLADANQADNTPYTLRAFPAVPTALELLGIVPLLELPTPPPIQIDATGKRISPVRTDTANVRRTNRPPPTSNR